jgi:ornithine cyclodeaminase/alanine dehydrogenase-like protein (mu-crystallin family)
MLLLSKEDVAELTEGTDVMGSLIDAIDAALIDVATDTRWRPPALYPGVGIGETVIPLMGVLRSRGVLGGRVSTIGKPSASGPGGRGYKVIFDLATLNLVALIEDVGLHSSMVGAHVGVATRVMSRADSQTVGAIGSGTLAMSCLEAVLKVRAVRRVLVFSPNEEHRLQFAEEVSSRLGVRADGVGSSEEAVTGADIVNCATNNYFRGGPPVFDVDWLAPGAHVNTIGRREAPAECVGRTSIVVPSIADYEAIVPAWEPGPSEIGEAVIELSAAVAGKHRGRTSDDERTVYLGPSIPAEHLALAAWVRDLAIETGVGTNW